MSPQLTKMCLLNQLHVRYSEFLQQRLICVSISIAEFSLVTKNNKDNEKLKQLQMFVTQLKRFGKGEFLLQFPPAEAARPDVQSMQ